MSRTSCGIGSPRCCRFGPRGDTAIPDSSRYRTGSPLAGIVYVMRKGVAWRDVPSEVVGCSGMTAWRRLRDRTEVGVWPRLHAALLTELRRADLLDLDDCAVDGSHVRALKGGSRQPSARRPLPSRLPKHHLIVTAMAPRLPSLSPAATDTTSPSCCHCWTPSRLSGEGADAPAARPSAST